MLRGADGAEGYGGGVGLVDLDELPEAGLPRLEGYQRMKDADDEWWEVQRLKFKRNLGEELTIGEANTLAYSRYGDAPGCHHP